MWILGIVQFVFIAVIAVWEFKLKSPAVFLWATLLIMFGLMHMINSITGDYMYSDTVLSEASLFVIGFCIIYAFIRYLLVGGKKKTTREVFQYENVKTSLGEQDTNDSLLFLIFVLAMALKLIPYIRFVGSIFSSSWSEGRDYSANLGYMNTEQLARIFIYSLSGLAALFIAKRDKKWIAVSALLIIGVLLTRNRIEILPFLCSIIAVYLYKQDRLNIKVIVFSVIAGFAVIYLVYALRVFRHYGTVQDFLQRFDLNGFNNTVRLYLATDNGELGLRRDFYFFLRGHNRFENFGKMHSYLRMLLVYLPTSWSFGLKPDDFAIAMGQAMGMRAGGSTHPTLFGDCYANLGGLGVLLGGFWAAYASIADSIIVKRKRIATQILLYVLNAVVYVIIGRGSVYNGFWFVAFGVPLLVFVESYLNHSRKPRFKIVLGKKHFRQIENFKQ